MKNRTLTFAKHRTDTPWYDDHVIVHCPFTAVDTVLIGSPEQSCSTEGHELVVTVSALVRLAWKLNEDDLVKVAFAYGKREMLKAYKSGRPLARVFEVKITGQQNIRIPFDPQVLELPNGQTETVHELTGLVNA